MREDIYIISHNRKVDICGYVSVHSRNAPVAC
jgi:hypothetical protein